MKLSRREMLALSAGISFGNILDGAQSTGDRVELLRAGTTVPLRRDGSVVEFTIPGVRDYEVAVIV